MENVGFIFGLFGFLIAASALQKITSLEKKLKEIGVLDKDFDSEKDTGK